MLPSVTGNRQRRKKNSKNSSRLYKPRIEYTDDGFPVTTLYIRSLRKEITRSHLIDYFSKFGNVQNARIHTKANCFGFVTFARAESASKALASRSHKINGCTITVTIADSWHQEKPLEQYNNKANPVTVPIELTNVTGTHLVDLNDDCLYEIFSLKLLNIMDLCSVAETSTRLKGIATRIFATSHRICKFNDMSLTTIHQVRRFLINFGSSITDLTIGPSYEWQDDSMSARVLDLVIRYCSKSLESLRLNEYDISEHLVDKLRPMFNKLQLLHIYEVSVTGDCKKLFANCGSLVELKVVNLDSDGIEPIFENRFPKLERFKYQNDYYDCYEYDFKSFVSQQKGLKAFRMNDFHSDCSPLLPVIAGNLSDLENLQITGHGKSPHDYVTALKSLLVLKKLKKLKIKCDKENVTKFLQELPQLSSLEFLELWHAQSDAEFIPALSQLKTLNVLRLRSCTHIENLNALGGLEKLNELSIILPASTINVDIELNVIDLVKRLVNLKKLIVGLHSFKVDRKMYLQMVNIVRGRTGRLSSPLELMAFRFEDGVVGLQLDAKNKDFVKLKSLGHEDDDDGEFSEDQSYGTDEYSDSDFDPFDVDYDSDGFDFPPAFLLPFIHQQMMHHLGDIDDESDDEVDDEDIEVW